MKTSSFGRELQIPWTIGDERAVWPLKEAVSDDCEDVKVTAKEALVRIGKRR
jgi:HEAT repeat protein